MSIEVTIGRPPEAPLMALSDEDAPVIGGLLILGGLAAWAETGSPGVFIGALLAIVAVNALSRSDD